MPDARGAVLDHDRNVWQPFIHALLRRRPPAALVARWLVLAIAAAGLPVLARSTPWIACEVAILVLFATAVPGCLARARWPGGFGPASRVAAEAALVALAPAALANRAWMGSVAYELPAGLPILTVFIFVGVTALERAPARTIWAGVCGLAAWFMTSLWLVRREHGSATDALVLLVREHATSAPALFLSIALLAVAAHRARVYAARHARIARHCDNLARYFPPGLVPVLASMDESVPPQSLDVAVLFVDIASFTTLVETMAPEQVLGMLRDFHGRMEKQTFRFGGTIEKYIGDAVLATFGVPGPSRLDALHALACAHAMSRAVEQWNVLRLAAGQPRVDVGIGLHYGPVVAGRIGSRRNAAWVTVGDTVNTASRLQALTRDLGCAIVASDAFILAVRTAPINADPLLADCRRLGPQGVRGREHPVVVWVVPPRQPAV